MDPSGIDKKDADGQTNTTDKPASDPLAMRAGDEGLGSAGVSAVGAERTDLLQLAVLKDAPLPLVTALARPGWTVRVTQWAVATCRSRT